MNFFIWIKDLIKSSLGVLEIMNKSMFNLFFISFLIHPIITTVSTKRPPPRTRFSSNYHIHFPLSRSSWEIPMNGNSSPYRLQTKLSNGRIIFRILCRISSPHSVRWGWHSAAGRVIHTLLNRCRRDITKNIILVLSALTITLWLTFFLTRTPHTVCPTFNVHFTINLI